jgi:hypothetical protein
LIKILDLGEMPPANSFLTEAELNLPEKKFPLVMYFCNNCKLIQLLDVVNPEYLFTHYDYLTSASQPLTEHFINLGEEYVDRFIKSKSNLVIEIGGNDGVLLESIKSKCRVLNIDPAVNIANLAEKRGVTTVIKFFSLKVAQEILSKFGQAKIVTGSNVFAHIDDLDDLFQGVRLLIGENGIFVMEVHWVGNLLFEAVLIRFITSIYAIFPYWR